MHSPKAIYTSSAYALSVLFSCALCLLLSAEDKPASPPIEHKDYTLFMGADFQIQRNNKQFPVTDVVGDSFVIDQGGERVLVPVNRGDLKLRVDESLKLTPDDVSVHDLVAQRAYTPAHDPRKKFIRENMANSMSQDIRAEDLSRPNETPYRLNLL